jgi:hypothetical protein
MAGAKGAEVCPIADFSTRPKEIAAQLTRSMRGGDIEEREERAIAEVVERTRHCSGQ